MKTLRIFAICSLGLSLVFFALSHAKPIRKTIILAILHGVSWITIRHLTKVSAPVYTAKGQLDHVGCDLAAKGYAEALKDVVFGCTGISVVVPFVPLLGILGPLPALISVIRDLRGVMRH